MTSRRDSETQRFWNRPFPQANAAHAILHDRSIEVKNQSHVQTGNAYVRQHLSEKHWIEAFDALDFHHNFAVNNEIWPMLGYELALVEEWHANLPFKRQPCGREFEAHRGFVDRFKKPGSEVMVHFNGTPDDSFGDIRLRRRGKYSPLSL